MEGRIGNDIAEWHFIDECPIPKEVNSVLTEGERAVAAYKTLRDSAVFTTKRLIYRDAEGFTGRKVEVYSLPYESILMWSSENASGMLDFTSEVQLWTRVGNIKLKLDKHVDIRALDKLIAAGVHTVPMAD